MYISSSDGNPKMVIISYIMLAVIKANFRNKLKKLLIGLRKLNQGKFLMIDFYKIFYFYSNFECISGKINHLNQNYSKISSFFQFIPAHSPSKI